MYLKQYLIFFLILKLGYAQVPPLALFYSDECEPLEDLSEDEKAFSDFLIEIAYVELITTKTYENGLPRSIINGYPQDSAWVDTIHISKRQRLPKKEWDDLVNLFYGYKYKYGPSDGCYWPRNGIVFYDDSNNLIGLIEICFQCNKIETWGHIPEYIGFCDGQEDRLVKLFLKYGFKYGVEKKF